jgi:hypothetical protein
MTRWATYPLHAVLPAKTGRAQFTYSQLGRFFLFEPSSGLWPSSAGLIAGSARTPVVGTKFAGAAAAGTWLLMPSRPSHLSGGAWGSKGAWAGGKGGNGGGASGAGSQPASLQTSVVISPRLYGAGLVTTGRSLLGGRAAGHTIVSMAVQETSEHSNRQVCVYDAIQVQKSTSRHAA